MLKKIIPFFILLFLLLFYNPTFAQNSSGEGLTISPPISEIDLTPGKVYDGTIKLNNPTKEVVEVYTVARNFSASGETGVPTIENPGEDATYGLASWIALSQSKIALTPEQDVEFKYKIKVPTDAEPGGHYGSVLFASQPPKPNEKVTQVALASMVGSLILAKIPGNIIEKADVKEFSSDQRFYLKPPVDFILRITNSGNIHFKPKGEIVVSNLGKKVASQDINPQKGNILPNSIRKFDGLKFTGKWYSFGKFNVKLAASYGEKNQPLSGSFNFWIIPWWLITIVALIILLVIYFLWRNKRKKRRKPIEYIQMKNPPSSPPPTKKRIILQ